MCHGPKSLYWGWSSYNGALFSPLRTWVDEFIPYYMAIMGVDRPDRTNSLHSLRMSKVVSTHLWNTPLNLYHPAIKGFRIHSWRTGDCRLGVLQGCVVIFLETDVSPDFLGTKVCVEYHGPPNTYIFRGFFMVNNPVFRWPKPLFFMVLGAHGI